jgi:hypothetical protein
MAHMPSRVYASFGVLVLALCPLLGQAAKYDDEPIKVDLKSFVFKEEKVDLFGYNEAEGKLFFYTNGKGTAKVKVPDDGDYEVIVKASADEALNEGANFKLTIDGKMVGKETTTKTEPKDYTFETNLKSGEHEITIAFTNDVYKEGEYDRNLFVQAVTLKKKAKK